MNVTDEDRGKRRKETLLSPPYTKFLLWYPRASIFPIYVEVNMPLKILDCLTVYTCSL